MCASVIFGGYCLFTDISDWLGVSSQNLIILFVSNLYIYIYSSDILSTCI